MPRANIEPHKITVGTQQNVVFIPDVYDGIKTIVGVAKIPDSDVGEYLRAEVNDLIKTGRAARIRVGYTAVSGTRTVLKYAQVLCDIDKVKTAMGALPKKSFKGGTIRTAGFSRKRRLG